MNPTSGSPCNSPGSPGSTLGALLSEIEGRGLRIVAEGDRLKLRGGPLPESLRPALVEHRQALLRLHRPGLASWRHLLSRADVSTREAWALLSQGYEAGGLAPRAAEYLAWTEVAT